MFDNKDLNQLDAHGVSSQKASVQIDNFKKGFPFLSIVRAAAIGDGIISYSESECEELVSDYDNFITNKKIVKFVPASGAATRMFKAVFEYVNESKANDAVENMVNNIEKTPFYEQLINCLTAAATKVDIARAIISKEGLNYGNLPKGVLMFHKYGNRSHTPVEEQLIEGASYAIGQGREVNVHFTVSVEFQQSFEELVSSIKSDLESKYDVKYNITFSNQMPSTDTIAVDMNNEPFRNDDGSLLLRPAGHGALIENFNNIDADIIFVKNIDNVAHCDYIADTVKYKKVLGALLFDIQKDVFSYLNKLENNSVDYSEVVNFIKDKIGVTTPTEFNSFSDDQKKEYLVKFLNRPIRVAGMVKNQGEPGGGPFWVKNSEGIDSLQIAESSQISPEQISLMETATHFNPVDLVCATKNYKGEQFDLIKFVDYNSGFISEKSKDGKSLKALELPGLWNGAMSNWISLFVEVPVSTFNPVKEVADLLKEKHNSKVK